MMKSHNSLKECENHGVCKNLEMQENQDKTPLTSHKTSEKKSKNLRCLKTRVRVKFLKN